MRTTWMLAALVVPTVASAAPIPIAGATASSTYTEQAGYGPERVFDGKQGTAWVEGDPGSGLGAWLELDLGGEHQVAQLRIWAGDWSSWDAWNRANRPKELELRFSDGTTQDILLKDEKVAQVVAIEGGPKATSSLRLRLKGAYNGTTWLDTGISEIQVLGPGAGPTATASSQAKEDGDGNYLPSNAVDGLYDSMWCEGDAGDGTGEWLQVDLGAPRTVSKLQILNGIGSSMVLWMKANQATGLRLAFSDGSTHDVALTPSFRPTEVSFPPTTTSSVKVTFTGVKAGKEFNDLCVSELRFSE